MTTTGELAAIDLVPASKAGPRAIRLGLVGGAVAVFVSVNGMVEAFSGRLLLGSLTLGEALLLSVPLLIGYLAGRPEPVLEGFTARRPGWRNVLAGLVAGLASGVSIALFVLLVASFDIRGVFLNATPELVRDGPRILTFGLDLGAGLGLLLVLYVALGSAGGVLQVLPGKVRRAVLTALGWVAGLALMQPAVAQVLGGIQRELRIWTAPLTDFLYDGSGALSVPGIATIAAAAFGLQLLASRQHRKPVRTRLEELPDRSRRILRVAILALLLLLLGLLPQVIGPFLSEVLNIAGIFLLMALGLNIVVGFAGLLDLGYVAFFAVGAYTTALLTSPQSSVGVAWVFWLAVPFVVLAAAVSGLMVGTPVLRMRGDYLAIVTLGFGEIARLLFISDWLKPLFGGAQGIIQVGDISLGPVQIRTPEAFFYVIFVFVLLAAYATYTLQDSRIGRAWMAMREDEAVAEAMGVNIVTAKLSAFIVGAVLAGFGGALFATKIGSVFPHSFNVIVSITVLVVIIVGGMASVPGVVLGTLVLVGLPELLREFEEYRFLIYGALLIFMMLKRPEGFIPSGRRAEELHEQEVAQDEWLAAGSPETGPTDADRNESK